jgi:predicted amidophosphoribosyltransferase
VLACLHAFCSQCIAEWHIKSQSCPLCRLATDQDCFLLLQVDNSMFRSFFTE